LATISKYKLMNADANSDLTIDALSLIS
jgi:fused